MDYTTTVMIVSLGVPVVGITLLMIGEMISLRLTEWLESTKILPFSLANAVCSFIVGAVLIVVDFIVALMIGIVAQSIGGQPAPQSITYNFLLYFVLFVINWVVFFFVRMLTKRVMVKTSGLTWKYHIIFSMIQAVLIASVFPVAIGVHFLIK